MATGLERFVELERCFNLRDLGGHRTTSGRLVRERRLFRSDALHGLTSSDRAKVAELGLVTVVDLRTAREVQEQGRFEGGPGTSYHRIPFVDVLAPTDDLSAWEDPRFVADQYRQMLDGGAASVRRILRLLTSPEGYPVVFHCRGGRDRTGVIAALVLGLLGVPDELIVADYVLSEHAMPKLLTHLASEYPDIDVDRASGALLAVLPESMSRFIADLRASHGSFEGYAAALGLSEVAAGLRAALLVKDAR